MGKFMSWGRGAGFAGGWYLGTLWCLIAIQGGLKCRETLKPKQGIKLGVYPWAPQ